MTIRGTSSEVRKVIDYAQSLGYTAERTKALHIKFIKPGKPPIFFSGTPSDNRAIKNAMAQLKRAERVTA